MDECAASIHFRGLTFPFTLPESHRTSPRQWLRKGMPDLGKVGRMRRWPNLLKCKHTNGFQLNKFQSPFNL